MKKPIENKEKLKETIRPWRQTKPIHYQTVAHVFISKSTNYVHLCFHIICCINRDHTVVISLYYSAVLTDLLWGVWQSSNAAITQPHENEPLENN